MSDARLSIGSIQLNTGSSETASPHRSGNAFRVLVLSDFTGRENCQRNDPASINQRRMITVDRDNLEDVLEQLNVQLDRTLLTTEGEHVSIKFDSLDDFHPDELFDKFEVFESLRKLRRQLLNPNLCQNAIDEINSWQTSDITLDMDEEDGPEAAPTASSETSSASVTVEDLFGENFAKTEAARDDVAVQWQQIIADIARPYSSKPVDPRRDEYVEMVDQAIQRAMRSLLHHPHFVDLEAAWRSVALLTSRLETSSKLTIQICDVSKTELIADLMQGDSLHQTQFYQQLVEKTVGTPGGKPWTLIVADFRFGNNEQELSALARLSQLADTAGSTLLVSAEGDPDFWCDVEQVKESPWPELRALHAANSVAVFWPRFLLRLPYGRKTSTTERIAFEEIDPGATDEGLLWCNGAFLAALKLAQQFADRGWELDSTDVMSETDLPLLVQMVDGESEVRSTGQHLLSEEQIKICYQMGLTPIVSIKGSAEVAIQGMQSLAGTRIKSL